MREIETSNGIARIVETGSREKGSRIIETNLPNIRGSFHECRLLPLITNVFRTIITSPFPSSDREKEIARDPEEIVEIDASRDDNRGTRLFRGYCYANKVAKGVKSEPDGDGSVALERKEGGRRGEEKGRTHSDRVGRRRRGNERT